MLHTKSPHSFIQEPKQGCYTWIYPILSYTSPKQGQYIRIYLVLSSISPLVVWGCYVRRGILSWGLYDWHLINWLIDSNLKLPTLRKSQVRYFILSFNLWALVIPSPSSPRNNYSNDLQFYCIKHKTLHGITGHHVHTVWYKTWIANTSVTQVYQLIK